VQPAIAVCVSLIGALKKGALVNVGLRRCRRSATPISGKQHAAPIGAEQHAAAAARWLDGSGGMLPPYQYT
jgi:hypothetical protein